MNIKQLIEDLNKVSVTQKSDWLESVPEPHRSLLANKPVVADRLDVDKHRWYETAICVFAFEDTYIGVRYCSDVFSEESSISDINWTLTFFEMEATPEIVYKKKEKNDNN